MAERIFSLAFGLMVNWWTTAARRVLLGTARDHSCTTRHVQNTVCESTVINMTKKWNSKVIFDKGNVRVYVDSSNKLETFVLWNIMPCISAKANRPFVATYRLQLQGWKVRQASNQHFSLSACYILFPCVDTCILLISASAGPHPRNPSKLTTDWILLSSDMWRRIPFRQSVFLSNPAVTVSPCYYFIYHSTHYALKEQVFRANIPCAASSYLPLHPVGSHRYSAPIFALPTFITLVHSSLISQKVVTFKMKAIRISNLTSGSTPHNNSLCSVHDQSNT
jgi:hypothetical protein